MVQTIISDAPIAAAARWLYRSRCRPGVGKNGPLVRSDIEKAVARFMSRLWRVWVGAIERDRLWPTLWRRWRGTDVLHTDSFPFECGHAIERVYIIFVSSGPSHRRQP